MLHPPVTRKQNSGASRAQGKNGVGRYVTTLLLLAASAGAGSAQLMAPAGKFEVNSGGAATYSLPIVVPPGTAGMKPILTLEYNSQNRDGILGTGWALGGLPAITRCPRTMIQNGVVGAINFDANDRFCLEGQQLTAISGTYGADGTEYRTEVETFSRIISRGTAGTGPAWFEVRTKTGEVLQFGNTADSRPLTPSGTARSWVLNRRSDTKGNYLTVTYTNDATNGQIYPTRIDYTGNAGAGLAPYNSVRFEYATRPDIAPLYHAGVTMKTTVRLTNVKTYIGATLVSDYQVSYQQGTTTGRSRVRAIQLCTDGACLPTTTFGWTETQLSFNPHQQWVNAYGPSSGGWTDNNVYPRHLVDVNGDGLPDVVGFGAAGVYVSLNTGTSFGSPQLWINDFGTAQTWTDNNVYPRHLVDVNGDGRPDVVGFAEAGVYVSLNTGTSFGSPQLWINAYGPSSGGWSSNNVYPRYLVDVNGDGLPDVVGFATNGVYVSLNNGTSFGSPQLWINDFGTAQRWTNNTARPRFPVDINSDGLPDVVGFTTDGVYVSLNNGTSFSPRQRWINAYGSAPAAGGWSDNNVYPRHLVDVNGDEVPDIVGFGAAGVYVSLNTGTSFGSPQLWINDFGTAQTWTDNNVYPRSLVDVNGDGRPDVVGFATDGVHVSLNTGTSFGPRQRWINDFGTANSWTNNSAYPRVLVDVNGDGLADVVGFAEAGVYVAQEAGGSIPDLQVLITNGLGAQTAVTFKPLTVPSVYTKSTGTLHPQRDITGGLYVVSRIDVPNGIGGTYSTAYSYVGAKTDVRGRFLGFRQVRVQDLQTNIVQTTTFRQDFPFVGMPESVTKTLGVQTLNQATSTYQFLNASGAATVSTPSITSAPYRVSVGQTVTSSSDLDGSAMPTVTTSYQYDAFGNATQVVVSTPDGFSKTTTNTYTNDTTNWFLGRLTGASVLNTTP
jgi:hypothetical protein